MDILDLDTLQVATANAEQCNLIQSHEDFDDTGNLTFSELQEENMKLRAIIDAQHVEIDELKQKNSALLPSKSVLQYFQNVSEMSMAMTDHQLLNNETPMRSGQIAIPRNIFQTATPVEKKVPLVENFNVHVTALEKKKLDCIIRNGTAEEFIYMFLQLLFQPLDLVEISAKKLGQDYRVVLEYLLLEKFPESPYTLKASLLNKKINEKIAVVRRALENKGTIEKNEERKKFASNKNKKQ